MSNFENALNTLNATVSSIAEKVDNQKNRVASYKRDLIGKLGQIANSITNLRNAGKLDSIPQLKSHIAKLTQKLTDKDTELAETNKTLNACQGKIRELQEQINALTRQISEKDTQIQQLETSNKNKDDEIAQLKTEKQALEQEKQAIETNLATATQEISTLSRRILDINDSLKTQIDKIVTIMDDLDVNHTEVDQQFTLIQNNIDTITKMINDGSSGGDQSSLAGSTVIPYNVDDNINKLRELINLPNKSMYEKFIGTLKPTVMNSVVQNMSEFKQGNETNMRDIFTKNNIRVSSVTRGGKHKTMKKRHKRRYKRTCKSVLKGGYVYSSSSKLDKSSSIISSSSKGKSVKDKSPTKKVKPTKKKHRQLVTL